MRDYWDLMKIVEDKINEIKDDLERGSSSIVLTITELINVQDGFASGKDVETYTITKAPTNILCRGCTKTPEWHDANSSECSNAYCWQESKMPTIVLTERALKAVVFALYAKCSVTENCWLEISAI